MYSVGITTHKQTIAERAIWLFIFMLRINHSSGERPTKRKSERRDSFILFGTDAPSNNKTQQILNRFRILTNVLHWEHTT